MQLAKLDQDILPALHPTTLSRWQWHQQRKPLPSASLVGSSTTVPLSQDLLSLVHPPRVVGVWHLFEGRLVWTACILRSEKPELDPTEPQHP